MKKTIAMMFAVMMLAGCSAPLTRIRYANPNATHEQFYDVSYQCEKKVEKVIDPKSNGYGEVIEGKVELDCDRFNACMQRYGFVKSPEGTFLTSKDLPLRCK